MCRFVPTVCDVVALLAEHRALTSPRLPPPRTSQAFPEKWCDVETL